MATTTNFIQLPPDGVGKKVRHRLITDIVIGTSYVNDVPINGTVYGSSSGAIGVVVGKFNASDASISWYVNVTSGTFTVADSLWSAAGGTGTRYTNTVTTVTTNIYEPSLSITDAKTPEYTLSINKLGAAGVVFSEGAPQFDAMGHMQMSQMLAVGEYYNQVQDLGKYAQFSSGTGSSVTFDPLSSQIVYVTGTGATDLTKRVTNQYHPYKPGTSQLTYISLLIGDAGVANAVREWGYFDNYNGFGFRLDGTTLKVFLRSDVTGTAQDIEVTQANWNTNTLISATSSDFALDVTKPNLYWMDVQGISGRIRLGVETPDGRRIVCHYFQTANTSLTSTTPGTVTWTGAACRNLSLPVTWAQRNTAGTSGATTMKVGNSVVFTESADVKYTGVLTHIVPQDPISFSDNTTYKPFLSFKAKTTVDGPSMNVTNQQLVSGVSYTIESAASSNFTTVGAASNNAGTVFTANATGTIAGNGLVHMNIPNSIIGIHETFDWASSGASNIHVGIFVLPSENWLVGYQWSSSIQPQTMLYVDQQATSMAQYQYWGSSATGMTGAINNGTAGTAGTTMSVTTLTAGAIMKEMYVVPAPLYAQGPLSAGFASASGVTARTRIVKQLTSTGSAAASPTYGTQLSTANLRTAAGDTTSSYISVGSGVAGSKYLVVSSTTGLAVGQLIAGTNLPVGTTIEQIVNSTLIMLSNAFTGTGSGTYNCYTMGGIGTYQVDTSQNATNLTNYGAYYAFGPIESFVAPANSAGRAALGDRIEKSFGLGGNPNPPEDQKGVFVFAGKTQSTGTVTLLYTKYWKEIR